MNLVQKMHKWRNINIFVSSNRIKGYMALLSLHITMIPDCKIYFMGVLYEQFSLFELPDITSEQDTFSHHSYHRT